MKQAMSKSFFNASIAASVGSKGALILKVRQMKNIIIIAFLFFSAGACNDDLSYTLTEKKDFSSFSATLEQNSQMPSQKMVLKGQSLSLLHEAELLDAAGTHLSLHIAAILSDREAELKIPEDALSMVTYGQRYRLMLGLKSDSDRDTFYIDDAISFFHLAPQPYDNIIDTINVKSEFEIAGKDILGISKVVATDIDNGEVREIADFEQSNRALSFRFPPFYGNYSSVKYYYYDEQGAEREVLFAEKIRVLKEEVKIGSSLEGLAFSPRSVLRIENKGAQNLDLVDEVEFLNNDIEYSGEIIKQEETCLHVIVPQELRASANTTLRLKYYESALFSGAVISITVPDALPNVNVIHDYSHGRDDDGLSIAAGSWLSYGGSNLGGVKKCYLTDEYNNETEVVINPSSTASDLKLQLPFLINTGRYSKCRLVYEDAEGMTYDYVTDANINVLGNPLSFIFFDEGDEHKTVWKDTEDGATGYYDEAGNPLPIVFNPGAEAGNTAPSGAWYMGFRWTPSGGIKGTAIKAYMFYARFRHSTADEPLGFSNKQKYLYFYYKTGESAPPRLYLTLYNNGANSGVPSVSINNFSTEEISDYPKKEGWLLCCIDLSKVDLKNGGLEGMRAIRFAWTKFTEDTPDCEGFMDRLMISDRIMPGTYLLNN